MRVAVFIAEGLEEVEALSCVDVLRRAQITCDLISCTGNFVVQGSHGISLTCDRLLEDIITSVVSYTTFVFPGGMPGTLNLQAHEVLRSYITAEAQDPSRILAAICAAPQILAHWGLIDVDTEICAYPGVDVKLREAGYTVCDRPVIRDGRVVTARSVGSGLLFGLELVEALKGREARMSLQGSLYLP